MGVECLVGKPSAMGEGSAEIMVDRRQTPTSCPGSIYLPSASVTEPNLFLTHSHQQLPLSPFTQVREERLQSCSAPAGSVGVRDSVGGRTARGGGDADVAPVPWIKRRLWLTACNLA